MHDAARYGHANTVKALKEAGADVNAGDHMGQTPVHWAAINGHTGTVNALKEAGADLNATDKDGKTPLDWAARKGHDGIVPQGGTTALGILLSRLDAKEAAAKEAAGGRGR